MSNDPKLEIGDNRFHMGNYVLIGHPEQIRIADIAVNTVYSVLAVCGKYKKVKAVYGGTLKDVPKERVFWCREYSLDGPKFSFKDMVKNLYDESYFVPVLHATMRRRGFKLISQYMGYGVEEHRIYGPSGRMVYSFHS
jgi:hypothetical protein